MRRLALWIPITALLAVFFVPAIAGAQQESSTIPLPNGFRPEGISIGERDTFYVGSIPTGAIYQGNLKSGKGGVLVPPQPGRAAVGLMFDTRQDLLWVAGGGTGDGYVYDARSGAGVAAYDFADASAGGTFINDVFVTRDAAWFTDAQRSVLYRVPIDKNGAPGSTSSVEVVQLPPALVGLNGIEGTPDGSKLIVVQSSTGKLFAVDAATHQTAEIVLANGESVPMGDGLLLNGDILYVVQNRLNLVAKVQLSGDLMSGSVLSRTTDPNLDVPSTVDRSGNDLYLVNARFGVANPDTAPYWVTRIPAP